MTEYQWDHRNRLTRITEKDSLGAVTQTADYAYDVFDRRIAKSVDDQSTVQTEYYVLDGQHVALRLDEEGLTQNRYLYGRAVDQILADERVTSQTSAGEVVWALTDHLGTVRDIVKRNGSTTTVLNHIQYDAFGNVVGESNAAQDFQFGYTGRDRDEESGLNYYRARYYDPAIGQFVSEDPIGFGAGDENLYRYVGNSPTNYTDPNGLERAPTLPKGGPGWLGYRGRWQGERGNSVFKFYDNALGSIRYANNQPIFNACDIKTYTRKGKQIAGVAIDLASDLSLSDAARRAADYEASVNAMRKALGNPKWTTPAGYVWHHQFVSGTGKGQMILVRKAIHQAASHTGAFAAWTRVLMARQAGDSKALKAAHAFRRTLPLRTIGKVSGVIGVLCIAGSAQRGYADDGLVGAGTAIGRDMVLADEIEWLHRQTAIRGANFVGDQLMLNEAGDEIRLRGRFRRAGVDINGVAK